PPLNLALWRQQHFLDLPPLHISYLVARRVMGLHGGFNLKPACALLDQIPATIQAGERRTCPRSNVAVYCAAILCRTSVKAQHNRAVPVPPLARSRAGECAVWVKGDVYRRVIIRAAPAEVKHPVTAHAHFDPPRASDSVPEAVG